MRLDEKSQDKKRLRGPFSIWCVNGAHGRIIININVTVGYPTVGGVIDGDSCMPAVGPCIFEQVMSPFVLIPPTILFIGLLCNIHYLILFPLQFCS